MNELVEKLSAGRSFALISHIAPDGDTLGSALALAAALESLDKAVVVLCDGAPQRELLGMPYIDKLRTQPDIQYDTAVAIDCADRSRLGGMERYFDAAKTRLVIDHHGTNAGFGDLWYVDPSAAATGELILELFDMLGAPLTKQTAECLYTAIATDTGNFCFSNTTPHTFECSAKLLTTGFDLPGTADRLFRSVTPEKMQLRGLCISKTVLTCGNRLAYAVLDHESWSGLGVSDSDFDGIVDCLRDISSVQVCALFRQRAHGGYKASLRSCGSVDVAKIASGFGGGGHAKASGADISEKDIMEIVSAMEKAL